MLWTRQFGTSLWTSNSYNLPDVEGLATDNYGNIYISGEITNADGNDDAWVAKYDTQGNLLWTEQLINPEDHISTGVATDNYDNIYISGYKIGSYWGDTDAWVAKYDTQGNLLWTKQFVTPKDDIAEGVETDSDGNIYLLVNSLNSDWIFDYWIAKYDTQGNLLWTDQFGTNEDGFSTRVAIDSYTNIYISGNTRGSRDAWITKINQSNIMYVNRFQNNSLTGTYLFAGPEESQGIRDNFPNFIEEGQAFKVAIEPGDDLIRMNRFQNSNIPGTYLYAGEEESKSIRQNFSHFVEEGIAFYVFPGVADIGVDFYRFQNLDVPGTYIFAGPEERQNILDNYPNFVEEGVAFKAEI